jgi:hypothetical protein
VSAGARVGLSATEPDESITAALLLVQTDPVTISTGPSSQPLVDGNRQAITDRGT